MLFGILYAQVRLFSFFSEMLCKHSSQIGAISSVYYTWS